MQPTIESLIGSAFATAGAQSGAPDLVHAALAGLRLLRRAADRQAGSNLAAGIDAAIRHELLSDALRRRTATGADPASLPLPAPGPGLRRAAALLENAAATCLALNAMAPGHSVLDAAVREIARRIPDLVGGAPDREAVIAVLREGADEEDRPAATWTVIPGVRGHVAIN